MAIAGEHHPAFEEYCNCIFELREDGVDVIQARIAERLDVSRPAVSEMMRRLESEGLVETSPSIELTSDGEALAQSVVRRHRLAERFLTDVLQLSWAESHHEAGRWEHVMSESVEAAMNRLLDSPTTCPHGNPIPGSGYEAPDATTLIDHSVGEEFVVVRIPEELEFEDGTLEFLEQNGFTPGRHGLVKSTSDDGGLVVDLDGTTVEISAFISQRILVTK
ncbi:MAG: metal-dependent transcriptional regulator [Ilumatobacteraceae bacterium]|nr:metal-dependent transcriptional regulator [Ilumatobacteraceae bacterium]